MHTILLQAFLHHPIPKEYVLQQLDLARFCKEGETAIVITMTLTTSIKSFSRHWDGGFQGGGHRMETQPQWYQTVPCCTGALNMKRYNERMIIMAHELGSMKGWRNKC